MMNRFISIFLATALLCAFDPPAALFAQEAGGAISGKVISAEDGRPIEFAVISLLPSKIYTTTGSDGSYLIENIPAGEVTVEASFFGMSTESREISVPGLPGSNAFATRIGIPASSIAFDAFG